MQDLWREATNRVLLTGSSIGIDGAFGSLWSMDLFSAPLRSAFSALGQ